MPHPHLSLESDLIIRSMNRSIVIQQNPVVFCPQMGAFLPDGIPEVHEDVNVHFSCNSGCQELHMDDALHIKEDTYHHLEGGPQPPEFLRPVLRLWIDPLTGIPFCFWFISPHPALISGNDVTHNIRIVFN